MPERALLFEVIQQERILQNKDTLTLFTHGILMLGSPIGTPTYTRDYYHTLLPKIRTAITAILPVTDNLQGFTFASFSRASQAKFAASCEPSRRCLAVTVTLQRTSTTPLQLLFLTGPARGGRRTKTSSRATASQRCRQSSLLVAWAWAH